MSSFAEVIADALERLQAKGASAAELASARNVLAHLAECNRTRSTVEIGRGVRVALPGNPSARGLTLETRI